MKFKIPLPLLALCLACLVVINDAKFVGNIKDDDEGTITIVDIQDDNKTQYLNQNFEQGHYNYGYDIKPSGPVGQFHHENKASDNVVYGCYGYEASNGQNQMTFYISDAWGYRPVTQEKDIEIFYPADNPPGGTGHMHGTPTKWADLIFPDMCAHFAERIASSTNVVTKAPVQIASPPASSGTNFQPTFQPNVGVPVTKAPHSSPFGQTNSNIPSSSFDVIRVNSPAPSKTANTPAAPTRFTSHGNSGITPGGPFSTTGNNPVNVPDASNNQPSETLVENSNSGSITGFAPGRFSTPSNGIPNGTGASSIPNNANRNPPSSVSGTSTTPFNGLPTDTNASPPNLSESELSNVGPILPGNNREAGSVTQNLQTSRPFNSNRLITNRPPVTPSRNNVFTTTTTAPTNINSPNENGLVTGQTVGGITGAPSPFPSTNTINHSQPPSRFSPSVTSNEVPVGTGSSIKNRPNEALPPVTTGASAGNKKVANNNPNPYGSSSDENDETVPGANPNNRITAAGITSGTRTPGTRAPITTAGITRNPAITEGHQNFVTQPASNNRGSTVGNTPALSNSQGSTTFLLPNSEAGTSFPSTGANNPSRQETRRPTSVSTGTRRPSSVTPSLVKTEGNRNQASPTTTATRSPPTPARPSTGFSGTFNNPGTLQPSSTIQQTVPNQASRNPAVSSGSPINQVQTGFSEGSSVGIFNPTKQPGSSQQGTNRLANFIPQSTPSTFIPMEPDTDIQDQVSTQPPAALITGGGGSGNTGNAGSPIGQQPDTNSRVTSRQPTPTRSPSFSTRPPAPTRTAFQRPISTSNTVNPALNNTGQNPEDEFCTSHCSSCNKKENVREDEDFLQIPGAVMFNIPVIFYPDCSANAYTRPAIVPFCPTSQASQCGSPLTMKFPDTASFVSSSSHEAPVARNAFVSANKDQATRGARKVRRGRQQRQLRQ